VADDELAHRREVLRATLQLAVPLWIDQMRGAPWSHIKARAAECATAVASQGDVIMFRSGKKGQTAEAFNRLAEGIACAAFSPGGIKVFGDHYEARQA